MARFVVGEHLLLQDEEEDIIFCEILAYQGNGQYITTLTRSLTGYLSKRFTVTTVMHETDIHSLIAQVDIDLVDT